MYTISSTTNDNYNSLVSNVLEHVECMTNLLVRGTIYNSNNNNNTNDDNGFVLLELKKKFIVD